MSSSLTTMRGLPLIPISRVTSLATRAPDSGVSAISARHSRVVVDHGEDAGPPAGRQGVGDEVERPALVRPIRNHHRRPGAQGALAATAARNP